MDIVIMENVIGYLEKMRKLNFKAEVWIDEGSDFGVGALKMYEEK